MNFSRMRSPTDAMGMETYAARSGAWQFLIVKDRGRWTTSYRAIDPKGPVSVASTIEGPFDEFSDAADAADSTLARLKRLS